MTASRKKKPSQRDRLRARQRPTITHRVLVDADAAAEARKALGEAQARYRQVVLKHGRDSGEAQSLQPEVDAAAAAVDACYEPIVLRALPPPRVAELEAEHPPTPEQVSKVQQERQRAQQRGEDLPDWPSWNDDTFYPVLLSECAVESDMTVQDWADFLAENVSIAEAAALKDAVLAVNAKERIADSLVIPKGLTQIIS